MYVLLEERLIHTVT